MNIIARAASIVISIAIATGIAIARAKATAKSGHVTRWAEVGGRGGRVGGMGDGLRHEGWGNVVRWYHTRRKDELALGYLQGYRGAPR